MEISAFSGGGGAAGGTPVVSLTRDQTCDNGPNEERYSVAVGTHRLEGTTASGNGDLPLHRGVDRVPEPRISTCGGVGASSAAACNRRRCRHRLCPRLITAKHMMALIYHPPTDPPSVRVRPYVGLSGSERRGEKEIGVDHARLENSIE